MKADTTGPASPPDPPQDHPATTLPHNIPSSSTPSASCSTYGRHLIDTVRQRATAPNFNAIAACFGTDNLSTILAHLNRGILRAAALERVLLARAATGRTSTSSSAAPARRNHACPGRPNPSSPPPPLPPPRKRAIPPRRLG